MRGEDKAGPPASAPPGTTSAGEGKSHRRKSLSTFPSTDDRSQLSSSQSLAAAAETEASTASSIETRAANLAEEQFERRLGFALLRKGGSGPAVSSKVEVEKTLNQCMRAWDKNGDGELSRQEFRQAVRGSDSKSLGVKASNAEIDMLFDEFDADGGGSLTLSELRPCLRALQNAALATNAEKAALMEMSAACRTRVEELNAAAAEMRTVEAEEERIAALEHTFPLTVRLMRAMGNTRVEEIMKRFKGSDATGNIGRHAFVKGVMSMAIEGATAEQAEAWFAEELQKARGGEDGGKETFALLTVLRGARQATVEAKDAEQAEKKALNGLRRAARSQQAQIRAASARAAAEAREKEIAAQDAACEKQEAEMEAKRTKAEARRQKKAREDAKKAEFEAKVQERRHINNRLSAKLDNQADIQLEQPPEASFAPAAAWLGMFSQKS